MHNVTIARNQLGPLLDQLILELEAKGLASQQAYFKRVRGSLYGASDDWGLSHAIVEISSGHAMGFALPSTADVLMQRLLAKVSEIVTEMNGTPPQIH